MSLNDADHTKETTLLLSTRAHNLLLVSVVLLALALRLWGITFGLPMRTHVDEPAYVLSALKVASGDLWLRYPLLSPNINQFILAAAYGMLFVIGKLTGLYGSVSAFGQSYLTDPTPFYLIARVISALFSTFTVVVLYATARQLFDKTVALLAAFLLSLMFIDVRHAHFAEPYALISLLSTCSVYFGLRFVRADRTKMIHLLLSSILAGAAIALRFSLVPVLAVPLAAALVRLFRHTVPQTRMQTGIRMAFVGIAGSMLGFLLAYPGVIVRPGGLVEALRLYTGLAQAGSGFQGFVFNSQSGVEFYVIMFTVTLGIPMLISGLVGLVVFLVRPSGDRLLVLIFPVTYTLAIGLSQMAFLRYSVPLMPFLALFAAAGVAAMAAALIKRWDTRITVVVVSVAVILVIYRPLQNVLTQNHLLTMVDTRTIVKQWIEANIPANSKIALQWYSPPLATADDPEPDSQRIYVTETIDPFDPNPEFYNLDAYRADGFEYLVLSSFIYQLARVDPLENQQRADFYRSLDADARLVAEFKPADSDQDVAFMFEEMWSPVVSLWQRERPGPAIKIYEIRR